MLKFHLSYLFQSVESKISTEWSRLRHSYRHSRLRNDCSKMRGNRRGGEKRKGGVKARWRNARREATKDAAPDADSDTDSLYQQINENPPQERLEHARGRRETRKRREMRAEREERDDPSSFLQFIVRRQRFTARRSAFSAFFSIRARYPSGNLVAKRATAK